MSLYIKYFKLRLMTVFQYSASALAGIATQFFWGFMMLFIYTAFFSSGVDVGINLKKTVAYLWLYQAFLSFLGVRFAFPEITDAIKNGSVAYEIVRPYNLYYWWYVKVITKRVSNGILKFLPVMILAFLLPEPYNLPLPYSFASFFLFIITFILGVFLVSALNLLIYTIGFYTYNASGIGSILTTIMDFLAGSLIPVVMLPAFIQKSTYFLPFRFISDLPYRIYSGNIGILEGSYSIFIQLIWILILVFIGNLIVKKSLRKVFIQGG